MTEPTPPTRRYRPPAAPRRNPGQEHARQALAERQARRAALVVYTEDELLEELARRRNERELAAPQRWCHACDHFKAWPDLGHPGEPPEDFNPCTRGHAMQFRMPDGPHGEDYGFYRRVCTDRTEKAIPADHTDR